MKRPQRFALAGAVALAVAVTAARAEAQAPLGADGGTGGAASASDAGANPDGGLPPAPATTPLAPATPGGSAGEPRPNDVPQEAAPAPAEPAPSATEPAAAATEPAPAAAIDPAAAAGAPAPESAILSETAAPPRGFWAEALGGTWASRGELALEGRLFRDDEIAATKDGGLGLFGRLELRHTHGAFDEKVRFYGRLDHQDQQRSVLIWEEAFVQVGFERLRIRAGLDIVNWTATEAFHPADVINARNLDSDLENLEKIGEPMVAIQARPFDDTTVMLLAMPHRTEPIFASSRSRLSFAPGLDLRGSRLMIDRDGALTDERFGPQAALAIRQSFGGADLTLHVLEQMDRTQPLVRFDPLTQRPLLLFQTVQQVGGTVQQALGALLLKVEGAYRHFRDPTAPLPGIPVGPFPEGLPDHGQLAVGLEWGLTHPQGPESTFLLEGQTMLGVSGEVERAALSVFQRDVLVGYRLAMNDESGKELLLGAIFDTERAGEALFNVSYAQRLGETWTVKAGVRVFLAERTAPGPLAVLRDADHVRVTLSRHF